MTTAAEIIEAVDRGWNVHWSNEGYVVEHWPINDEYVIRCVSNDDSIGLTWRDGVTLNGKPEEFFALVQPEQLDRNANGSFFCPQCRCVVLLFDDDVHTCTICHWSDA